MRIRLPWKKKTAAKPAVVEGLVPAFELSDLMSLFPELSEHRAQVLLSGMSLIDVRSGEKVIATITGSFPQWLAQCHNYYSKRAAEAQVSAKFSADEFSKTEAIENYSRYDQQSDALKELMWLAIKMDIGIWKSNASGLSLRKGWKVVEIQKQDPREFFEHLFGQGEDND